MFDSFLQLAEDWAVHVDADALVEKGALDFLRAAIEALQRDASVSREDQVGLDSPKVRWVYIAGAIGTNLAHRTKPNLKEDIYSVLDNVPLCQSHHTNDDDCASALLLREWSFRTYINKIFQQIGIELVDPVLTVYLPELVHNVRVNPVIVIVHHITYHLLQAC